MSKQIAAEEFVRIWQQASSLQDAANALGMKGISASMHAARLRQLGVPLKRFSRQAYSSDEEFVDVLRVSTVKEVAAHFNISTQAVYHRMRRLQAKGIDCAPVGRRSIYDVERLTAIANETSNHETA